MRVWNTRPDAQKLPTKSVNPISEMIMNKITEYTSDHQTLGSHEQNPHQLKQLNKKVFVELEIDFISISLFQLLRMLEEEMTKNVALRKNIEDLAKR